jgi:hypothetical protein
LLITIRPAVKAKLKAIAQVEARPAWQVVEDALSGYFNLLPAAKRRAIQSVVRNSKVTT